MPSEEKDEERYPLGNPGWEFQNTYGHAYEEHRPAIAPDLLFAVMKSADCLWFELRAIRKLLEEIAGRDRIAEPGRSLDAATGDQHRAP